MNCLLNVVLTVSIVFVGPLLSHAASAQSLPVFDASTCEKQDVVTAIQAAMTTGHGIVRIPAGDCVWQGSSIRVKGNVPLEGAGRDKTILRLTPDRDSDLFCTMTDADYIRITGIGFFATDRETHDAGTATGIELVDVDNYRINDCHFQGDYNGAVSYKNSPKGLIDNCSFYRTSGYLGTNYGVTPGSSYTPFDEMPREKCDKDVCTCQVGSAALDRTSSQPENNTIIVGVDDESRSAAAEIDNQNGSGDGRIARLYIQIARAETDATIDIAAFVNLGDNRFTTRGLAENIPVAHGKNILRAGIDFPDIRIRHGDFIGVYLYHCDLDTDSAGNESWSLSGDQIPCTDRDFGDRSVGNASVYAELFDFQQPVYQCRRPGSLVLL